VLIWFDHLVWVVWLNVKLQATLRKVVVTDYGLTVAVDSDRRIFTNPVVIFSSSICSEGLIEGLAFLIEFNQLEVTANCVIKGNSVS
jgi:hypothetical protein